MQRGMALSQQGLGAVLVVRDVSHVVFFGGLVKALNPTFEESMVAFPPRAHTLTHKPPPEGYFAMGCQAQLSSTWPALLSQGTKEPYIRDAFLSTSDPRTPFSCASHPESAARPLRRRPRVPGDPGNLAAMQVMTGQVVQLVLS